MTAAAERSEDRIGLWAKVFPEVADPADLADLLSRIDRIEPSEVKGGNSSPLTITAVPASDTDVIFGGVMSRHLIPVFDETWLRLRRLRCVSGYDSVCKTIRASLVRASAEHGLRPLLKLMAEARAEGRLSGADPHERFADFDRWLNTPSGYEAFQRAFPDLLPRVLRMAHRRLDAAAELLERTDEEWPQICAALDLPPTTGVAGIELGQGDLHAGGRQVAVLTTDDGRRVVVKPRDIALEQQYGQFAAELGSAVGHELRVLKAHRSDEFGWIEHAEPTTAAPTRTFYAHVGVHLAALYLLNGTDIHYENLMSDGSGRPVVVDAEALFTPYLPGAQRLDGDLLGARATGLLSVGSVTSFEYGALDYRRGRESPLRSWRVVNARRDDMFLQMQTGAVEHPGVSPVDHRPDPADARALVESFGAVVHWVAQHRVAVRSMILETFHGRCRYIHRPTMSYAMVARMMTHPNLADSTAQRRTAGRVAVLSPPTPWAMVESEVAALEAGDIPAFLVDIRQTSIRDAHGREVDAHVREAPIERVLRGLEGLTEQQIKEQIDVVAQSVSGWHGVSSTAAGLIPEQDAQTPTHG